MKNVVQTALSRCRIRSMCYLSQALAVLVLLSFCTSAHSQNWYPANSNAAPGRYIGKIWSWWPGGGNPSSGSGVLVGPSHVLTAAHNIYDRKTRQWAVMVMFTPGQFGTQAPFGSANATKLMIPGLYQHPQGSQFNDVGLLKLNRPLGHNTRGWMVLDQWEPGRDYNLYGGGYSYAFSQGGQQIRSYGQYTRGWTYIHQLLINCNDVSPLKGISGGPLYEYSGGQWRVRAVTKGGWDVGPLGNGSFGTRLLWPVTNELNGWIRRNP